jgi:hypothetical protein
LRLAGVVYKYRNLVLSEHCSALASSSSSSVQSVAVLSSIASPC